MNDDKIVEYIIINKELDMGVGKIAGQVAHVQTVIDNNIKHIADNSQRNFYLKTGIELDEKDLSVLEWYEKWFLVGPQTKIILRAKEKDLLKAIEMGAFPIRDKGLTEIPAGSLTVVGFLPQPKSNLQEFTRRFQLL